MTGTIHTRMHILIVVLCMSTVWGYRHFQDEIPNGGIVPHPCKANFFWAGVGHINPRGGRDRNPFGVDFMKAGMTWTQSLCEMDSDGDGKTNGEELGDPECVWTKGSAAALTLGLSHPGVCTPHSAPACQVANTWVDCEMGGLQCDAAFNDVDLKNVTVRMPETAVPPEETHYTCMLFELPTDGDYHMVASEPYIDNANVMHHILVYACDDSAATLSNFPLNTPHACGMSNQWCTILIDGWGVGSRGECPHRDIGVRIGQNGYKIAMMQFHWTNRERRSDYTDSSGLTLYYTPNRRPHDAVAWMVGPSYLEIPPGQDEVVVEGWCSHDCSSRYLSGPIYITTAQNHMHTLGRKQRIEQYRNGVWLRDITNEETFSYDEYVTFSFDPPIEVLPGDEIKTTCTYNSVGKDRTTFLGEATTDEMCFGFLTIYPNANLNGHSKCLSFKGIDVCKVKYFASDFPVINECEIQTLMNPFSPTLLSLFTRLGTLCKPFDICTQECKHYVSGVMANNKCFQGDIGTLIRKITMEATPYFMELWAAIDSCKTEIEMDDCLVQCDTQSKNSRSVLKRG